MLRCRLPCGSAGGMSLRYAWSSWPLSYAERMRLMIAAPRWLARSDPANNQLALPMADGRI